jgi:hypothetical protein
MLGKLFGSTSSLPNPRDPGTETTHRHKTVKELRIKPAMLKGIEDLLRGTTMTNLNQAPPDFTALADITSSTLRSTELRKEFKLKIPELLQLERLMREHSSLLQAYREANIQHDAIDFPVYSLTLGSRDPNAPTLLLTGGIHGIERIGSQVLIAWLETLLERLQWDTGLQQQLQQLQLVVMPIIADANAGRWKRKILHSNVSFSDKYSIVPLRRCSICIRAWVCRIGSGFRMHIEKKP